MSTVDLDVVDREPFRDRSETASTPRFVFDPTAGPTPLGLGWDAEAVVVDWFDTGAADLLVTAGGGRCGRSARVYRPLETSDRSRLIYDAGAPVDGLDGLRCVSSLPNGGATRFDLVALDDEGLVWLPNEGDRSRPSFGTRRGAGPGSDLGIGPCRIVQLFVVDWDGDGLLDLLVGVDDLNAYWPVPETVPASQRFGLNQKGGHPGYDRNGLWRGRAPLARVFWLRNVGQPGTPTFVVEAEINQSAALPDLGLHPAALALSWGGGSSFELLITDNEQTVRVHRNFGGQRPPVVMEPRVLQCGHGPLLLPDDRTTVQAADIDGDRKPELIFGTADGRVFAVHAGTTRNEAKTPWPILHQTEELRLGGRLVLAAADLDADGDIDLIHGDAAGRLHLTQDLGGPGDHRYAAPVTLEAGGVPFRVDPGPDGMRDGPVAPRLGYACPAVADWTGNGRPDVLVGGAGGEVLLLRNDGSAQSPRFGHPALLRCQGSPLITPPRVRPAAADWLGTGQLDLIALDLQGFLCVYPRVDAFDVGPPAPLVDRLGRVLRLDGAFGQSGQCTLWAGPWTGAGRIDLLVGLPRGNRHVIPALCGVPLRAHDELPTVLLLENAGQGVVVPRALRLADGSPLVIGEEGCSPIGVDESGDGELSLLVGSDDGRVSYFRRDELIW
ncbi:MAG: hypothetical protein P4L84_21485 [Isosphaeraceae bacterium]|nr:hypothetical protein [Isosphaeraceae bacterium]